MFQKIIELSSFAHSFLFDNELTILAGNNLHVYNNETYTKKIEKELFKEYGLSRGFIADDKYFYVKDFIFLLVVNRESLEIIKKIKLGDDLRSDICGMAQDLDNIYLGMRNGNIVKIKKEDWENIKRKDCTNSSIWDMQLWDNKIIAGNVSGDILKINPETLDVDNVFKAHKKNTKSIIIDERYMLTAGQDLAVLLWDLEKFEIIKTKKLAHRKAFQIVGIVKKKIITVSYSCGEIKVWDLESFNEDKNIPIHKCLSGKMLINGNDIYITSRAINGLEKSSIDNFIVERETYDTIR